MQHVKGKMQKRWQKYGKELNLIFIKIDTMRKGINSKVHSRKSKIDSFSLPGRPISITNFRNWILRAERNNTITLNKAKNKWADAIKGYKII